MRSRWTMLAPVMMLLAMFVFMGYGCGEKKPDEKQPAKPAEAVEKPAEEVVEAPAVELTIEVCEAEMAKLEEWSSQNPEKNEELISRYGDVDQLLQDGDFDAAREPMIAAFKEGLDLAGGNVACAELLVDSSLDMMKEFAAMAENTELPADATGDEAVDPEAVMADLGISEHCQQEMAAFEQWSQEHPEIEEELQNKYPEVQGYLDNGEYDKAREPMISALEEILATAGADTACATEIVDMSLDMMKAFEGMQVAPENAVEVTGE